MIENKVKWISKEALAVEKPRASFREGVHISELVNVHNAGGNPNRVIAETIGKGDFPNEFFTRQEYEVLAGRQEEPVLYTSIYDEIEDASLTKHITINKQDRAGVTFEEVQEGGEVKFATVKTGQDTVTMAHYAAGIEYHEDMFIYNLLWEFGEIERDFGRAHNALLNHIHLNPILAATYPAGNLTAADATGANKLEKIAITLDNAIEHSKLDATNGRLGPYALMIAPGDSIKIANALNLSIQSGREQAYAGRNLISTIIEYNGYTNTRGRKNTTYPGVTLGTVYLISLRYRREDFRAWVKHGLRRQIGEKDTSRFIQEEVIWDTRRTMASFPLKAVEKITLP